MLRKLTIALAATLAIGAGVTATGASAMGRGHGMGMHSFHGFHHGFGFHGRFFGPGIGFYGYPYAYYGDDGCYQVRRVPTPWGWRWRRVWVCG